MSKSQSFDQTGTNIDQKIKWAQQIYSIQTSSNVRRIEEEILRPQSCEYCQKCEFCEKEKLEMEDENIQLRLESCGLMPKGWVIRNKQLYKST